MSRFKKLLFIPFAMMMTFLFPILGSASSLSPEETLEEALKQVVAGNIDAYISYIVDDSYESSETMREDYFEMFFNNPIVDFNILHSTEINDNETLLTVEITYENGEVTETQLLMEKISNQWKLIIRDLTPEENKVIVEKTVQEESDEEYSTNGMSICNYYFYNRSDGSTFYSECKFTPPSSALVLYVREQFATGVPTIKNPSITYDVVEKHVIGSTVYSNSVVVNGAPVIGQRFSLTMKSSGVGREGLQIRFRTNSDSIKGLIWEGRGSLEY